MEFIFFREKSSLPYLYIAPFLFEYIEDFVDRSKLSFIYNTLVIEKFIFTNISNDVKGWESIDFFFPKGYEDTICSESPGFIGSARYARSIEYRITLYDDFESVRIQAINTYCFYIILIFLEIFGEPFLIKEKKILLIYVFYCAVGNIYIDTVSFCTNKNF